jgi:hypothetical protein
VKKKKQRSPSFVLQASKLLLVHVFTSFLLS